LLSYQIAELRELPEDRELNGVTAGPLRR
jgi:hypothetical protein